MIELAPTRSSRASLDARSAMLAAACVALFLLFALQQVVIGRGLGEGLSLGSAAMRVFAAVASVWLLWKIGIPPLCRLPLVAILGCLCVLTLSTLMSDHPLIAFKFALGYAT